jgi:hypothetical protein
MNQTVVIILLALLLFLTIWWTTRSFQRQVKRVISGERSLDDKDIWLRNTPPIKAQVLSKKETRSPQAAGIAKVDLELEIQMTQGDPIQVSTCWLVEIPQLSQLEPGNTVEVKFNPKKPKRVFPAVSWARLWLFSK